MKPRALCSRAFYGTMLLLLPVSSYMFFRPIKCKERAFLYPPVEWIQLSETSKPFLRQSHFRWSIIITSTPISLSLFFLCVMLFSFDSAMYGTPIAYCLRLFCVTICVSCQRILTQEVEKGANRGKKQSSSHHSVSLQGISGEEDLQKKEVVLFSVSFVTQMRPFPATRLLKKSHAR